MAPTHTAADAAPTPPAPELTHSDVAAAFVHLARLAAAHAGYGIEFIGASDTGSDPYPPDKAGLKTLMHVAKILLRDQERMHARSRDVLVAVLHEDFTRVYARAQENDEVEEQVEDLVAERARKAGFILSESSMKRFAVNRAHITEQKGPSQAAAAALGDALNGQRRATSQGRSIFDARRRRAGHPPIPGHFNRHVPLRDVRRYVERALSAAEAQHGLEPMVPLEALRSLSRPRRRATRDECTKALLNRVEILVTKRTKDAFERGYDEMTGVFLALLRGENPLQHQPATQETEQACAAFRALGAELLTSSSDGEAALVQKAREAARWLIEGLKKAVDD
jgi:hypothetical protein